MLRSRNARERPPRRKASEHERYLRDGGDDVDVGSVGLQYGW